MSGTIPFNLTPVFMPSYISRADTGIMITMLILSGLNLAILVIRLILSSSSGTVTDKAYLKKLILGS